METRDASPSHFLINIESFSLLDNRPIQTVQFDAGGYKWRLIIYPYGDDSVKDHDHISVYLAMVETSSLPSNWAVNASFSIFLFNQISRNYLYSPGTTRCFRAIKSEWGISKFISCKNLCDPSNGYLIDDKCVFGAEVFLVQRQTIIEYLSTKNVNKVFKRDFNISKFSELIGIWYSEEFDAGGHKWKIHLHPKGNGKARGRYVSVFLEYVGSKRVEACFTIRMKSQVSNQHHVKRNWTHWFPCSGKTWGRNSFIKIDVINDPKKGFLVNDSCLLDIEISVKSVTQVSSLSV